MRRTTAVLLAAGAGTRLGRGPKALLPYRGTTLMAHLAAQLLQGGCQEVVVVIGAGAGLVRTHPLPPGTRTVENPRWAEGMGGSFALGVASAGAGGPRAAGPDGAANVLVALVDQPGVDALLVARLLAAHRQGRIAAAGYSAPRNGAPQGGTPNKGALRRGHPVVFDARLALEAAALATGDAGAREFLKMNPELVDLVDCSDLDDGADLDTPAQLYLLERDPH